MSTLNERRVRAKAVLTLAELLDQRLAKDGPVPTHRPDLGPCWVAKRARGGDPRPDDYVLVWVPAEQLNRRAHAISWEVEYGNHPCMRGPIMEHICVLHRCDNMTCARPSHLFLGTRGDNIRDMHAKKRNPDFRGERCGKAKLTDQQVRSIRRRVAGGESQESMLAEFGIASATMSRLVNRHTWRHVKDEIAA